MLQSDTLTPTEQHGILWLLGAIVMAGAIIIWFAIRWALVDRSRIGDRYHALSERVRELEIRVGSDGEDGLRGEILKVNETVREAREDFSTKHDEIVAMLHRWNNDLQLKFSLMSKHSGGPP